MPRGLNNKVALITGAAQEISDAILHYVEHNKVRNTQ